MSVLFGHPTGNPNSHNAALAYYEAGLLECLCIPWMPSTKTLNVFSSIPAVRPFAERFGRRQFLPLVRAPKVQGRFEELLRLLLRISGLPAAGTGDGGNRWLMRTMARECHRQAVTAVHAYEDCSLWQFMQCKRLGKSCIYDLPTCYCAAWDKVQAGLFRTYSDWVRSGERSPAHDVRLEQKRQEIELADLTLVASRYVEGTIREFYPYKQIAQAPYGVDLEFWTPGLREKPARPLRFIYAGHLSVRKGVPLLIEAWSKADLRDAELVLAGSWALSDSKQLSLPKGITWFPPCSSRALRERFRQSDVFVFPSFADGFGVVLLEAMACGLPAIASETSIGPEVITRGCGFVVQPGDLDQLVELLRWFHSHQNELPAMSREARNQAERWTWGNYRSLVTRAVSKFI